MFEWILWGNTHDKFGMFGLLATCRNYRFTDKKGTTEFTTQVGFKWNSKKLLQGFKQKKYS